MYDFVYRGTFMSLCCINKLFTYLLLPGENDEVSVVSTLTHKEETYTTRTDEDIHHYTRYHSRIYLRVLSYTLLL